jgi:hypothetical protein
MRFTTLLIAFASMAAVAIPGFGDTISAYEVTGQISPGCLTSNEVCGTPPGLSNQTAPFFGAFSFYIEVGGSHTYSLNFTPTPPAGTGFDGGFTENFNFASQTFHVQATYPVADIDGFPGFDLIQRASVFYTPPSTPDGEAEIDLRMTLQGNYVAELTLYFTNGTPLSGSFAAGSQNVGSQFNIDQFGGAGLEAEYSVENASLTPVVATPEPASAWPLALTLAIGVFARRGRRKKRQG